MKKLICDMDLAREHELFGTDILVFSALCYLCYRGDWEINYTKLAEEARCGSRQTAMRALNTLAQKHLITIIGNMVHIASVQNEQSSVQNGRSSVQNEQSSVQNGQSSVQNEQSSVQNGRFCEKESNKEKEINKENKLVSYNKGNQPTQVFKKEEFIIPSQSQIMEYAQQHNIPATVAQKWYLYWEQHSWTQPNGQPVGKWQPCLEGFALRENNCSSQLRNFEKMTHGGQSLNPQRSLTYLEQQEEIHRQIKAEERAKREADWAERENNRAAAEAFFARHPDWLSHT